MKHTCFLVLLAGTFFGLVYRQEAMILTTDTLSIALINFTKKLNVLDESLKSSVPSTKKVVAKVDDTTYKVGNKTIKLVVGDIVKQENIDVLVNAANTSVATVGSAGIALAIRNKMNQSDLTTFGNDIKQRYKLTQGNVGGAYIGKLQQGSSLNNLGYTHMVNAVGPNCNAKQDVNLVANAYRNSLQEVAKLNLKSIILPRISAVLFGCPAQIIDRLAVDTVVDYLVHNPTSSLTMVYFIFFGEQPLDITSLENYKKLLSEQVP